MCLLSWNMGASTSWNPQDLSRPVMGLLYLFLHRRITIYGSKNVKLWRTGTLLLNISVQKWRLARSNKVTTTENVTLVAATESYDHTQRHVHTAASRPHSAKRQHYEAVRFHGAVLQRSQPPAPTYVQFRRAVRLQRTAQRTVTTTHNTAPHSPHYFRDVTWHDCWLKGKFLFLLEQ